ncbi:5-methylthioadenosine/S-adenosylhomocysteine deaminase [Methylomarinovum caldicuralii]|uniref:5-methylthioadenosine/S-adenosylhomocysteine deaminase n=1 Tax=Methylomarinovum caldicuralii TaxID=438856 RepID=A0AAU9BY18_9GAMM|nr:TRZ/ATZ family hydrolase [Methylomarinovum caldicuralii]BCX81160.1 5-methylthioadenosine/S-adenosylhomocysteine deaminase [Methylomarinovum caldicuralii]
MEPVDILIQAGWIIPVVPAGELLVDGAVAVADGRIVALCSREEAARRFRAAETVSLPDHALIPGLVNAHTHAAMTLLRGIADDVPLMEWLNDHIWPREVRWVDAVFVRTGTRLAVAEMLRGGTTCFADMYFFPDAAYEMVRETGIRAALGLIFVDFPTPWARCPEEYLEKNRALLQRFPADDQVQWLLAPHAPYSVGDATFERIAELADHANLRVHLHLHETTQEIHESLDRYGERPLARLERLELVNECLLAAHMVHLTEEEIETVAERGVHVLHCPESNLKLASGFCPVARLADRNAALALGTDGAASNNDLDLIGEMRTAALLAKGVTGDPEALPAARVLEMATLGGAEALHFDHCIGSLEPGKYADIVAIDLGRPETQPCYDPVSQIVYAATREQVTDVWVGGRRLLRERRLTTLDWPALRENVTEWQLRLAQPLEST